MTDPFKIVEDYLQQQHLRHLLAQLLVGLHPGECDGNCDCGLEDVLVAWKDIQDAAGECLVDLPEPGSDMSKLLIANRMLARERDNVQTELDNCRLALDATLKEGADR